MQRSSLTTIDGVPAEITQAKYVIKCQGIGPQSGELPCIAHIDILTYLQIGKEEQRTVIAGPDERAGILYLAMFHKSSATQKILEKPTPFGHHIVIGIHPCIEPSQVLRPYLTVITRAQRHVIARGYILGGPKTVYIVCLIKFLPEKGELGQHCLAVVESEVPFTRQLIWIVRKMVLKITQADELAVQDRSIGEEFIVTEVPAQPDIMHPIPVFKEKTIRL